MINQLRTLLLNISGTQNPGFTYPGEEYVPPEFVAKSLPVGLANAHRIIFGANPDRAMMNYRLREIMAILHTTPLSEFVYDLDPRVTYWPPSPAFFTALSVGPTVKQLSGTAALYLNTVPGLTTGSDQLDYAWQITVLDGSHVQVQPLFGAAAPTTYSYTLTDGLSSSVSLPGSDVTFHFQSGIGAMWQVSWLAKPARNLADVIKAVTTEPGEETIAALFEPEEPYRTFKNLWSQNPYAPFQLGGFALALGYKTNDL